MRFENIILLLCKIENVLHITCNILTITKYQMVSMQEYEYFKYHTVSQQNLDISKYQTVLIYIS